MSTPKRHLIIIQDRETQFDAPLYATIHQQDVFSLELIYSTVHSSISHHDLELGHAPQWDHILDNTYDQRTLPSTSPLQIWTLSRQLKARQPDLVIICGYYPRSHLLLALLLRLQGQRIGLRSDNTLTHTSFTGWKGPLRRLAVSWIQRLFDCWHPVGDQAHAYLRQISGTLRPTYRFAYAVDNDWLASNAEQARQGRHQFLQQQGWPEDAFVVLGIMKWTPREDPLTLIHAFRQLLLHCSRARLVLIGDGPLQKAVMTACAALTDVVTCPGYSPYSQLPLWYGRADVFVHPAPHEPWGVSVNEALACGLPVIAAEGVGAAAELIRPGVNGDVFVNGDVGQLAAQLLNLSFCETPQAARAAACRATADHWHYRHSINRLVQALTPC